MRAALALLIVLVCPGCITAWLWDDADVEPPIDTRRFPGTVVAARGNLTRPERPIRIALDVDMAVDPAAPGYLNRLIRRGPVHVDMTPLLPHVARWHAAAAHAWLAAESCAVKLYHGGYFHSRSPFAEVAIRGRAKVGQLAPVIPESNLPAAIVAGPALTRVERPRTRLDHCLDAFDRRDWGVVAFGTPARSQEPLTWVTRGDQPIRTDHIERLLATYPLADPPAAIEHVALVGRVVDDWGRMRLVRVPVFLLLIGEDMSIERNGTELEWSVRSEWRTRLRDVVAGGELAPLALRLDPQLWFSYSRRVIPDRTLLNILRTALTPVTAALDFLVITNPVLRFWYELLLPRRADRPGGRGGRR